MIKPCACAARIDAIIALPAALLLSMANSLLVAQAGRPEFVPTLNAHSAARVALTATSFPEAAPAYALNENRDKAAAVVKRATFNLDLVVIDNSLKLFHGLSNQCLRHNQRPEASNVQARMVGCINER